MPRELLQNRFMEDWRFAPLGSIANRVQHITARVQIAYRDCKEMLDKCRGGYFCAAEGDTGNVHFTVLVGDGVPQDKLPEYYRLAHEKVVRLAQHPTHLSSYQSRDGESKLGGAVRTPPGWIMSFSGFPELIDEALVLVQMRMMVEFMKDDVRNLLRDHCAQVANISSNEYYPLIGRHCYLRDF